jgi:hypothetical protein
MTLIGAVVEWDALGEVVVASLLAGVGVTLAFSLAIYGSARFADMRAEQRTPAAVLFAVIGALGYAACLAALVGGILVMTSKS